MKVSIKKVSNAAEESAVISVVEVTDEVADAIALLENGEKVIIGYQDNEAVPCPTSKIYYIESTDDKTFLYTKEECLEVKKRLYELEEMLDYRFFRCSKSMICNLRKIKSVKTEENSKMVATLLNEEKIIISRSYVKTLKKRLGLG